ncbi:MAG TPA: DUF2924 domain-containing protein [Croceibacterium sp.]|nr:DUF2924 domain-containing protein [Croceibacterium sp.]
MQIEIDFEVFKALTALRHHEEHSYNEVLRELLGLDSVGSPQQGAKVATTNHESRHSPMSAVSGLSLRGLLLPNGTQLRATYKGSMHLARIENDKWVAADGNTYTSPSAAAYAISNTNVNGWRFWEAKQPGDPEWRKLEALSKGSR